MSLPNAQKVSIITEFGKNAADTGSTEVQIALALRTLCGLSPAEIAAAFLTTEAAIARVPQSSADVEGWLAELDLAPLLKDPNAFFYVCGLKAMEEGVVLALRDIAQQSGRSWDAVGSALKREGRLHLETY
mgnify:CR=1 FL=1